MTNTPHHSSSLTRRAGLAVGFRLGGNVANVLLGLGLGVILARLLPPREFGMFGVGLGITAVAEILGSFGMLQALVQRKTVTGEDEATAAIVQTGAALLVAAGLVLAGPHLENLFGMPGLGILVQLQAAVLVIHALGVIPSSRLSRRLAFDRLTATEIVAKAFGGAVSIMLAIRGMGALSLTVGSIAAGLAQTCLVWIAAPGRFPLKFRSSSARSLLGFGTAILFSRIFNELARQLDVFIIGQRLGAEVVGLYQRSFQLVSKPMYQFTGAVSTVLFPAMASLQDQTSRFQRGYLTTVGLTTMLAFPLLTLLWTMADILIPFLYGSMWTDAVPIMVSLAFVGYLRIVNNPNGLVTQSRGRVKAEAYCQAVFMILTGVFAFVGTFYGVQAVVVGIGLASIAFLIMMTRLALSISGVSFSAWLRNLRTPCISSVFMAVAILGMKALLQNQMPNLILLLTLGLCGLVAYLIALRTFLSAEERDVIERILGGIPSSLRDVFLRCLGTRKTPVYE